MGSASAGCLISVTYRRFFCSLLLLFIQNELKGKKHSVCKYKKCPIFAAKERREIGNHEDVEVYKGELNGFFFLF